MEEGETEEGLMANLKNIYDEHTKSKPYINSVTAKTLRVSTPTRTKKSVKKGCM